MLKNRYLIIVVGALLIVAVYLIANAIGPQVGAVSSQPPVGFGDLRYAESQLSSSNSAPSSPASMADLRRFELQQSRSSDEALAALNAMRWRTAGRNSSSSPLTLESSSSAIPEFTLAQQADIARWKGLAGLVEKSSWTRAQLAEIARWNALAAQAKNALPSISNPPSRVKRGR